MGKPLKIEKIVPDWVCYTCKKTKGALGFLERTVFPRGDANLHFLCFGCLVAKINDGTFNLIRADPEGAEEPTESPAHTTDDGTVVITSDETRTTEFNWT